MGEGYPFGLGWDSPTLSRSITPDGSERTSTAGEMARMAISTNWINRKLYILPLSTFFAQNKGIVVYW